MDFSGFLVTLLPDAADGLVYLLPGLQIEFDQSLKDLMKRPKLTFRCCTLSENKCAHTGFVLVNCGYKVHVGVNGLCIYCSGILLVTRNELQCRFNN